MTRTRTILLTLVAVSAGHSAPLSYQVELNTGPLAQGGSYFLDFQLVGSNSNVVDLTNFAYGGGTGSAATIMLDTSTNFFNESTEPFTAGAELTFDVNSTNIGPPASGFPDELSFFLLDSNNNPLPTSDPADAFFYLDLTGGPPTIETFSGSGLSEPTLSVTNTPEPATGWLLLVAASLSLLGARLLRSASR